MPVYRTEWAGFPNVCVHSTLVVLRAHPAYAAAKEGDLRAARSVVHDLYKPGRVTARTDFVAPVVQLDVNERWNALPLAFAVQLARETGARVIPTIVQTNVVHHTSANSLHRFLHQPEFAGKVPAGTYLILDDVVTMGSTLANLRGHLERHGGTVAAATTLAAGIFGARIRSDPLLLTSLQRRFGHDLSLIRQTLGFGVSCLTRKEAYFLRALPDLVCLRNEGTPAIGARPALVGIDPRGNETRPRAAGRERVIVSPSL